MMNAIEKSESIKTGLGQGFQDGSSKIARRKCYGYKVSGNGGLIINSDEAQIVRWIFEQYLSGDSLGKIAAGLEQHGVCSPSGKPKWNREAIDKLLSNEKLPQLKIIASWIGIFTPMLMRSLSLMRFSWQCRRKRSIDPEIMKKQLP